MENDTDTEENTTPRGLNATRGKRLAEPRIRKSIAFPSTMVTTFEELAADKDESFSKCVVDVLTKCISKISI